MDLTQIRQQIDQIDSELVRLFCDRMALSAKVADYKKANNLPIFVPARERAILQKVAELAGPEMSNYSRVLYSMLFELSRSYQSKRNGEISTLFKEISHSIEHTPKLFPQAPTVACQGVEGAYSQIACEKIFKSPFIMHFKNFEAVFTAIEQGMCQYGILPIENSTAGSVTKVYDLMIRHNFSIVRTFRLKVYHNLLANPGASLSDIKTIYSHPQALRQCADYLDAHKEWGRISVLNTAVAAKKIMEEQDKTQAAIASRTAGELYGLKELAEGINNEKCNTTRFIVLAKAPVYEKTASKVSIMFQIPHVSGSLYNILGNFIFNGVNMLMIESRPIPEKTFEYRFFVDFEGNLSDASVRNALTGIKAEVSEMKILGNY